MRTFARNISAEPLILSKAKMEDLAKKTYSTLHQHVMWLYSHGFVADIRDFVEYRNEVIKDYLYVLRESLSPEEDANLHSIDGSIIVDSLAFDYVSRRVKDEDVAESLRRMAECINCAEIVEALDIINTYYRIPKTLDDVKVKMNIAVSTNIKGTGKLPLHCKEIAECVKLPQGCMIDYVNLNVPRLDWILDMLEVEDKTLKSSYFFGEGFTREDDVKYLPLLLRYGVSGGTPLGDKLKSAIDSYYCDFYTENTGEVGCFPYITTVFVGTINTCNQYLDKYRAEHMGYREVFLTSDYACFAVGCIPLDDIDYRDFYIGTYLIDSETGSDISIFEQLHGFGGEFVQDSYDIETKGQSVVLDRWRYWSTSNVCGVVPIIRSDDDYVYEVSQVHEICGVSLEDIPEEIVRLLGSGSKEYDILVGVLLQALCCVKCAYTLDKHDSPAHVLLPESYDWSWLTSEYFDNACKDAEYIYKKLGF